MNSSHTRHTHEFYSCFIMGFASAQACVGGVHASSQSKHTQPFRGDGGYFSQSWQYSVIMYLQVLIIPFSLQNDFGHNQFHKTKYVICFSSLVVKLFCFTETVSQPNRWIQWMIQTPLHLAVLKIKLSYYLAMAVDTALPIFLLNMRVLCSQCFYRTGVAGTVLQIALS